MKQSTNDELCGIMYSIRDAINHNDSIRALSLSNDLYFILLRLTLKDEDIRCEEVCDG